MNQENKIQKKSVITQNILIENAPSALFLHIFIAFSAEDPIHDINIILGLALGSHGIKGDTDEIQPFGVGGWFEKFLCESIKV